MVPHLLSEEMVSEEQRALCRTALYGSAETTLPVSPLGQCALALRELGQRNPSAVPIVIGGDHSLGWPALEASFRRAESQGKTLGILHFDAHTDLLPSRLGVAYCFATWAY